MAEMKSALMVASYGFPPEGQCGRLPSVAVCAATCPTIGWITDRGYRRRHRTSSGTTRTLLRLRFLRASEVVRPCDRGEDLVAADCSGEARGAMPSVAAAPGQV